MQQTQQQNSIISAPFCSQHIIAGPGSGKTHVLTQRIIHLIQNNALIAKQTLVLTFSVKASLELKHRLSQALGNSVAHLITIKTFHAYALKLLCQSIPQYQNRALWSSNEQKLQLCEELINTFRHMPLFPQSCLDPSMALNEITQHIRTQPLRYLKKKTDDWLTILARIVQQECAQRNLFLFDFLCIDAIAHLQSHPPPFFQGIFVDEFQDLTPLQFELLRLLLSKQSILTVVGDPNQSIYGWRGGNPKLLSEVKKLRQGMKQKSLSRNFRCPQAIVAVANLLISHNDLPPLHTPKSNLAGGRVCIHRYASLQAEIEACAHRILSWIEDGIPPQEIAVLARTGELVQKIFVHLRNHPIPLAAENPLRSPQGQQLLAVLHYLHDQSQLETALNFGKRRLRNAQYKHIMNQGGALETNLQNLLKQNNHGLDAVAQFVRAIRTAQLATSSLAQRLQTLFSELEIPSEPTDNPHINLLMAVSSLCIQLAKEHETIPALIETLTEIKQERVFEQSAVSLITLHKAKGLEFTQVCILGNQNNIFPNFGLVQREPSMIEEERRLLYVGLTRSKREVHLSNHTAPTDNLYTERDGFLAEIASLCE